MHTTGFDKVLRQVEILSSYYIDLLSHICLFAWYQTELFMSIFFIKFVNIFYPKNPNNPEITYIPIES